MVLGKHRKSLRFVYDVNLLTLVTERLITKRWLSWQPTLSNLFCLTSIHSEPSKLWITLYLRDGMRSATGCAVYYEDHLFSVEFIDVCFCSEAHEDLNGGDRDYVTAVRDTRIHSLWNEYRYSGINGSVSIHPGLSHMQYDAHSAYRCRSEYIYIDPLGKRCAICTFASFTCFFCRVFRATDSFAASNVFSCRHRVATTCSYAQLVT